MGIPAPSGVGAAGSPPTGDQANAVISGTFAAAGTSAPFAIYGAFNVVIWGTVTDTLTTTASSSSATAGTGTGLFAGQTVNNANVPKGTTIGAVTGTAVTLAFPAGKTNANVTSATAASTSFGPAAWAGTVSLDRSFDGAASFQNCGQGGGGVPAIYYGADHADGSAISFVASEPEKGVLYRLNCSAYASGTINYRISTTGMAATAWGVPMG